MLQQITAINNHQSVKLYAYELIMNTGGGICMKNNIFNIIQIGDKSNRISRAFDIFITITIFSNIIVTFLQTFDELAFMGGFFKWVEYITLFIFCVEYILRIWTADLLYPECKGVTARFKLEELWRYA